MAEKSTSLDTWRELAETTKLGWPEWDNKPQTDLHLAGRFQLRRAKRGWALMRWAEFATSKSIESGEWRFFRKVGDHEAASLFERHARPWLEERGVAVSYGVNSERYFLKVGHAHYRPHEASDALGALGDFGTWVAAAQAAVRAVAKEGKDG